MSAAVLTVEVRKEGDRDLLVFSGALTESAVLTVDPTQLASRVVVDLQEVRRINSAGAQAWTSWLSKFSADQKIMFERLPPPFVQLASVVDGMIPATAEVDSFFVPYFDESRGEVENVLFVKDRQYSTTEVSPPEFLRSPVTNGRLEIDVAPEKYFRFLRRCYPRISL